VFDFFTRIVDAPLMYPYSSVVEVQIDASQLSNIPTRAYRIKGLYIAVPTNYFPGKYPSYTRNTSGVNTGRNQPWNGTFYTTPSNNPAWVFYDMATNARYGAGEYLGGNIDKWGLYQIGQYCDQLVPDGFGGWEVRFACNTYIQSQEVAWKVLSDLASVFRGLLYWGQGMVVATADMPKPIMHNFTCANVVDGRFTYQDTELKNRFSDTEVTYNDPDDFFKTKIQSSFDTDMRVRYGYRDSKFTSYGCTSRGQAHRHGEYVIVTNKYEVETVTFQTGFEAMYLRPGDIIGITDSYRIGLRQGGRVKAFLAGGHYVQLDGPVGPFADGQEINFFIAQDSPTLDDNFGNSTKAAGVRPPTVWTGHIYYMGGKASNVIWVHGGGGATVPGYLSGSASIWVIGANLNNPNYVPVAQFRVISITERAPNLFEITALTYEPAKFDLIDLGIQFTPPTMTRIHSLTNVLPPNNLTATLQATIHNNVVTLSILLSWEQPPDDNIRSYQIWIQPPNGGWGYVTETSSTSWLIASTITGLYHFRVNSVNTAGITSNPATVSITVPDTSLIVPHRMSGLEIQNQGNGFTYYSMSPVLAWRLNSPSKSFLVNSEAPYGAGVGTYDPYFVHFVVRVYDGALGPLTDKSVPGWIDYTTALQYTIDIAKNAAAWGDGKARHNLIVTVQDVDAYGLEYAPQPIYIDNPPPPPVTNLVAIVQAGTAPKVVGLSWIDPRTAPATAPEAVDVTTVRIYKNSTNTFPGGTPYATTHSNSNAWNAIFSSGTYYFFVTLVDSFGSESTPTSGVQAVV
jgi:hypothetical protein